MLENAEFIHYKLTKSGSKSDYVLNGNGLCVLNNLSDNETILNGFQLGKAFKASLNSQYSSLQFAKDDKITINGEDYFIQSIVNKKNLGINMIKLILFRE